MVDIFGTEVDVPQTAFNYGQIVGMYTVMPQAQQQRIALIMQEEHLLDDYFLTDQYTGTGNWRQLNLLKLDALLSALTEPKFYELFLKHSAFRQRIFRQEQGDDPRLRLATLKSLLSPPTDELLRKPEFKAFLLDDRVDNLHFTEVYNFLRAEGAVDTRRLFTKYKMLRTHFLSSENYNNIPLFRAKITNLARILKNQRMDALFKKSLAFRKWVVRDDIGGEETNRLKFFLGLNSTVVINDARASFLEDNSLFRAQLFDCTPERFSLVLDLVEDDNFRTAYSQSSRAMQKRFHRMLFDPNTPNTKLEVLKDFIGYPPALQFLQREDSLRWILHSGNGAENLNAMVRLGQDMDAMGWVAQIGAAHTNGRASDVEFMFWILKDRKGEQRADIVRKIFHTPAVKALFGPPTPQLDENSIEKKFKNCLLRGEVNAEVANKAITLFASEAVQKILKDAEHPLHKRAVSALTKAPFDTVGLEILQGCVDSKIYGTISDKEHQYYEQLTEALKEKSFSAPHFSTVVDWLRNSATGSLLSLAPKQEQQAEINLETREARGYESDEESTQPEIDPLPGEQRAMAQALKAWLFTKGNEERKAPLKEALQDYNFHQKLLQEPQLLDSLLNSHIEWEEAIVAVNQVQLEQQLVEITPDAELGLADAIRDKLSLYSFRTTLEIEHEEGEEEFKTWLEGNHITQEKLDAIAALLEHADGFKIFQNRRIRTWLLSNTVDHNRIHSLLAALKGEKTPTILDGFIRNVVINRDDLSVATLDMILKQAMDVQVQDENNYHQTPYDQRVQTMMNSQSRIALSPERAAMLYEVNNLSRDRRILEKYLGGAPLSAERFLSLSVQKALMLVNASVVSLVEDGATLKLAQLLAPEADQDDLHKVVATLVGSGKWLAGEIELALEQNHAGEGVVLGAAFNATLIEICDTPDGDPRKAPLLSFLQHYNSDTTTLSNFLKRSGYVNVEDGVTLEAHQILDALLEFDVVQLEKLDRMAKREKNTDLRPETLLETYARVAGDKVAERFVKTLSKKSEALVKELESDPTGMLVGELFDAMNLLGKIKPNEQETYDALESAGEKTEFLFKKIEGLTEGGCFEIAEALKIKAKNLGISAARGNRTDMPRRNHQREGLNLDNFSV